MQSCKIIALLVLSFFAQSCFCPLAANEREEAKDMYEKGVAYAEKGDLDAALEAFKDAIKIEPTYAERYEGCGRCY